VSNGAYLDARFLAARVSRKPGATSLLVWTPSHCRNDSDIDYGGAF
jgi:hypothetical protein